MINSAAEGWDKQDYEGIQPGTYVPFQPGLFTVKAIILGISQDNSQYILLLQYRALNKEGEWAMTRRYYYRDRRLIEGLFGDSQRLEQTHGSLRY